MPVLRTCLFLALAGCTTGGTGDDTGDTDDGEVVPPDCTTTLSPGDDDQTAIQAALIDAAAGDVICFEPGVYHLDAEVAVTTDDLVLLGAGQQQTVFDFAEQSVGTNGFLITADGVTVWNLQVRDTPGDAIRATEVVGITFRNVSTVWSVYASEEAGAYGLYPISSADVLVEGCEVRGARDAGIYVGQSSNILVRNNHVWGNVAGIEIENSTDAEVVGNDVHDNTGGILVFNLPHLPVQDGQRTKIHGNTVYDNNVPNFAPPGTAVSGVPTGTGLMVWAADYTEIHDNTVSGNITTGVLLISHVPPVFEDPGDPDFDPWSEGNWVHDNVFINNGTDPQGQLASYIADRPVPDLVYDGCEDGGPPNCFSDNGDADFVDVDTCGLFQDQNNDLEAVTCTHEPLDTIDL